ncbi:MAG: LicD family protein [Prevotella sp.]|nr:LicD family protein [Prevotella sp.]
MNKSHQYTSEELHQLHAVLYDITSEMMRVCDQLGLRYFIIGGTAIGAYYWQSILPWDDDIDIGMPRCDYERFLREAPAVLRSEYYLQSPLSEEHTPFWFAKIRKNGTLFTEHDFKDIDMHQGIFVDVFPFDKIPRRAWLEKLQYEALGFFNACFIGKELWQWRHCGRCQVDVPRERGFAACLITRIVNALLPKRAIYGTIRWIQTWFNHTRADRLKNIVTTNDIVDADDVKDTQQVEFGPLMVAAPKNLLDYLKTHYPHLRKDIPDEMKVNHRPDELKFG